MRNWTHKVVKFSRGTDGKFFAHRAAFTGTLDASLAYAQGFAAAEYAPSAMGNRLAGHRIHVIAQRQTHRADIRHRQFRLRRAIWRNGRGFLRIDHDKSR